MTSPIKTLRARKKSRAGFTLLELVFVAAILVIVASLAVPRFTTTFRSLQFQNFKYDVVSFIRYAQVRAIAETKTYRLVFDPAAKTMRIQGLVIAEDDENGGTWYTQKSKAIPDLVLVEIQDSKSDVKFYPDGTADQAAIKISSASGKNYDIFIEPATGYVKTE